MKALTLTQPWASLVAIGEKRIETRSWKTSYRGPLAIHAAKRMPADAIDICERPPFREALRRHIWGPSGMPCGSVIATARLVDCRPIELCDRCDGCGWHESGKAWKTICCACGGSGGRLIGITISAEEIAFGNFGAGRFAWFLGDIQPRPELIAARGALGLWEWDGQP